MINIMLMTFLFLMIPLTMMLLNMIVSKKMFYSREKSSPIECGFDPISNSRIPFSNQFFLISLIFLIFDIEITLLIPLVIMMKSFNLPMILTSIFFLVILIIGLYLEYLEQSLDWKK